ncbi:MAG: flavin reductase family protein [Thermoprotei archaeon]
MYVDIPLTEYYVLYPRPAYLIVSRGADGKLNVMSASWVTPVYDDPFTVAVSIWSKSLTHQYLCETGEATINVVGEEHTQLAYDVGRVSGREVDKWSAYGLRPVKSSVIKTPGIEGSLGFLECVVVGKVPVGESTIFLNEVKAVHVKKDFYGRHGWDLKKAKILMHCGGRAFTTVSHLILAERR